jgi:hypothetical protein
MSRDVEDVVLEQADEEGKADEAATATATRAARAVSRQDETFLLYQRDITAKEQRILQLEAQLEAAQQQHRAEAMQLKGALDAAQARLRMQDQLLLDLEAQQQQQQHQQQHQQRVAPPPIVAEPPVGPGSGPGSKASHFADAEYDAEADQTAGGGIDAAGDTGDRVASAARAAASTTTTTTTAVVDSLVDDPRDPFPSEEAAERCARPRPQTAGSSEAAAAAAAPLSVSFRASTLDASLLATLAGISAEVQTTRKSLSAGGIVYPGDAAEGAGAGTGVEREGSSGSDSDVDGYGNVNCSEDNGNSALDCGEGVEVVGDHGDSTEEAGAAAAAAAAAAGIVSPTGTTAADAVSAAAISELVSEYGRTSAQLHLLAQDLLYFKRLAEEALAAKADETMAAREAATAAVQACMRRADCEQELEEATCQLRDLQLRCTRLTGELEAEGRRNAALKARLQLYAEKLSALEVDFSVTVNQLEEAAALAAATAAAGASV